MQKSRFELTGTEIEQIVDIVIEKLQSNNSPKRALWIVEGTPKNYYVLDHAWQYLKEEYLIELKVFPPQTDGGFSNSFAQYGTLVTNPCLEYDLICLFNLSLVSLSRIANLMAEGELVELVMGYLQEGIPCLMDKWSDRHEFARMPLGIQNKSSLLLDELASYGIRQVSFSKPLYDKQETRETNLTSQGKIITLLELKEILEYNNPSDILETTRLTPLAIDYLRDYMRDK